MTLLCDLFWNYVFGVLFLLICISVIDFVTLFVTSIWDIGLLYCFFCGFVLGTYSCDVGYCDFVFCDFVFVTLL